MKRTIHLFSILAILIAGSLFFSCSQKQATNGTLTITAMAKDSIIPANTPIYLADSKVNLDNKVYISSGWLDANSSKIFRDLSPKYYWYKVEGWDNYGAAEVFAGVDASVILWLNSPSSPGK
ncbi:MAG: hypothetical protein ABSD71_05280 [Bacteroidales bacterium]|jgi:hypothetical protein